MALKQTNDEIKYNNAFMNVFLYWYKHILKYKLLWNTQWNNIESNSNNAIHSNTIISLDYISLYTIDNKSWTLWIEIVINRGITWLCGDTGFIFECW